jgi:hypothetical protein
VAEDDGVGIGYRLEDALGLLCAAHLETAMHACDDKIERLQNLVRVIERAVRLNVGFDAFEDPETPAVFPFSVSASACCSATSSALRPPA